MEGAGEGMQGWVDNIVENGEFAFVYSGTLWHRNENTNFVSSPT